MYLANWNFVIKFLVLMQFVENYKYSDWEILPLSVCFHIHTAHIRSNLCVPLTRLVLSLQSYNTETSTKYLVTKKIERGSSKNMSTF